MRVLLVTSLFLSLSAMADIAVPAVKKAKIGKAVKKEVKLIPMEAIFNFNASSYSPKVPEGSFAMVGSFNTQTRELILTGDHWIKQPPDYDMVNLKGKINDDGTSFNGRVIYDGCKEFVLKRTDREPTTPLSGKWEGSYICHQGVTTLKLVIK